MNPENPALLPGPDDPPSKEEALLFALLLLPRFECEWQRALTSQTPDWTYLLSLHEHMVKLKEGIL